MAAPSSISSVSQRLATHFGSGWRADHPLDYGNPDVALTGVAVSWSPTIEVLHQAVARRQNLVVSLEPPFWNGKAPEGRSPTAAELATDPTFRVKAAYLDQNGLSVLNVRDGWTARPEDGQLRGLAKALGWAEYYRPKAGRAAWAPGNDRFDLPPGNFGALARKVKQQLKAHTIRCIGDPQIPVGKVALTHGYFLVPDLQRVLADPEIDTVICGEPCEWEAAPYFMDLVASGQKKGMIILGSQVSSEPGCGELAAWLRGFIGEVPVEWLPAGEPFRAVG